MGDSAHAHIGYGFKVALTDNVDIYNTVDIYAKKMGLAKPTAPIVGPERETIWKPYWAARDKLWANANITVQMGGSSSALYPSIYVLIKDSHAEASWEREAEFDPDTIMMKKEEARGGWNTKLYDFCDTIEIHRQLPTWLIFAYYG